LSSAAGIIARPKMVDRVTLLIALQQWLYAVTSIRQLPYYGQSY
jgi:hypothetical protein